MKRERDSACQQGKQGNSSRPRVRQKSRAEARFGREKKRMAAGGVEDRRREQRQKKGKQKR